MTPERFDMPLRSRFAIRRAQDLIAEATMIHVCVDAVTFAKRPWPAWFRDRLPTDH